MSNQQRTDRKKNVVSFIPTGNYYYNKGLQALQRDQFDKGHKYMKRAVELSPDDPMILLQYAIVEMELQKYDHALELLQSAYSLDPNESDIVFFLAEVHAHLGMLREAKKFASKYREMDIDGPYGDEALEILEFIDHEFDIDLLEDSKDSEMHYLQEKARRLMERGEFEQAVHLLESVIEEFDDFWSAYNNLALAYFYIGEEEQAKALLHTVLRQDKGNLHALCNLAVFYYYEKNKEELEDMLEVLVKINPYSLEHRYKLGATFALVGKNEEAYKWLKSLQRKGFEGDPGFYFWLSHAAYFSGYEETARNAWKQLTDLDPTKKGLEPWHDRQKAEHVASEFDREFILDKLNNSYSSERLFGIFLLSKSEHRQEIISHPKWIDIEQLTTFEKLALAYSLGHQFEKAEPKVKTFLKAMETTELLYENNSPLDSVKSHLFQMWFLLFEKGLEKGYRFKNPDGIAAAADYMFRSSRFSGVTKKSVAEQYGVSVPTLTKYVNDMIQFLPLFE